MPYVCKSLTELTLPHDFDCNEPALNRFLLQNALENESRGVCTTHLFCEVVDSESVILGYFSLSTTPLDINHLDQRTIKRLPAYAKANLTATLLARLALDKKYHGKKLGILLLIESLKAVEASWKLVNSVGLLVHAKHDNAASFYSAHGFSSLSKNHLELFMPKKEVLAIVAQTKKRSDVSV
ncbi:hypothetical protein SAMN02745130_02165 [Thiothrix eikelboomii]|uniref:Acetyltransferase (GNAT) domain-containing protein n=1 Tax=Thiothrix eikelboomii TaxID=92487 RepID=A0A1T4WUP6_9GAMM|nr:GNAT family N-acetyltransferase [Thiothrix eikelboomii]SKA81102.1 hypothetical protein SAMN02745130_02165 [Thiothrix eikelboomii]